MIEFFKLVKLVRIMKNPTHAYTSPDGCVSYKNGEGEEVTIDLMGNLHSGAPVDANWSDSKWVIENANLRVARYRERMEEYESPEAYGRVR